MASLCDILDYDISHIRIIHFTIASIAVPLNIFTIYCIFNHSTIPMKYYKYHLGFYSSCRLLCTVTDGFLVVLIMHLPYPSTQVIGLLSYFKVDIVYCDVLFFCCAASLVFSISLIFFYRMQSTFVNKNHWLRFRSFWNPAGYFTVAAISLAYFGYIGLPLIQIAIDSRKNHLGVSEDMNTEIVYNTQKNQSAVVPQCILDRKMDVTHLYATLSTDLYHRGIIYLASCNLIAMLFTTMTTVFCIISFRNVRNNFNTSKKSREKSQQFNKIIVIQLIVPLSFFTFQIFIMILLTLLQIQDTYYIGQALMIVLTFSGIVSSVLILFLNTPYRRVITGMISSIFPRLNDTPSKTGNRWPTY